ELCADWRMRAEAAASGGAALQMLRRAAAANDPFGLVLVDHELPDQPAMTFARTIRDDPALGGARLALFASASNRGQAKQVDEVGFGISLTRPIRSGTLRDALVHLMTTRPAASQASATVTPVAANTLVEQKRKVLLVDDNVVNQRVASKMLER